LSLNWVIIALTIILSSARAFEKLIFIAFTLSMYSLERRCYKRRHRTGHCHTDREWTAPRLRFRRRVRASSRVLQLKSTPFEQSLPHPQRICSRSIAPGNSNSQFYSPTRAIGPA
jgi:hypothetical protein